jgi:NAD(P)-dependent dehydrogenase (short-subunit alcohol dehydrogenase family)
MRDVRELFDLHGRTALITGGAGHIGAALADALAELGAATAIVDIDGERAGAAASAIAARRGVQTLGLAVDLEDEHAVRTIPRTVVGRFGGLDIIVNCAALVGTSGLSGWAVPLGEQSATSWRRAFEVNLTAPFVLVQAAAGALAASGRGSVVNVLSIYGLVGPDERLYAGTPLGNPAAYGASKAGLMQLTRHFATTLAPAVRCNAITPGGVLRGQPAVFVERYAARVPLGRMAVEEDFKCAVAFLAGDASAYVTGQNIVIDGGWTAW